MDKREFLEALGKGLAGLAYEEQDKWLDFYAEMIDDRMEDGLSETEAVEAIGPVDAVITQILTQSPQVSQPKPEKKKRELQSWQIVLLIVGSPVWFSLLIAVASVIFSALVAVWSVVISFYAVAVSLVAVGLAGVLLPLIYIPTGNTGAALFCLGAGLFCAGLGILWFMGTHLLTKGVVWLCKKLFSVCFRRKEAVQ